MSALPIMVWTWTDDGAMCPLSRFRSMADRELVIGEHYRLQVVEERSEASHSHYFARLHDLWMSLPDDAATQFPTSEMLRKHALIMTGFRRERKFAAASKEEARKLAAFLRPQDLDDDYAIISINENVVLEWRALSQSRKGMPVKGQFYESKTKVLEWIEDLIGVDKSGPEEINQTPSVSAGSERKTPSEEINHEDKHSVQVNESVKADTAPGPLGARLRALAESLRCDTPEALQAAREAAKASPEALALAKDAPVFVRDIIKLAEKLASGAFTDQVFNEILGKIVEAAETT